MITQTNFNDSQNNFLQYMHLIENYFKGKKSITEKIKKNNNFGAKILALKNDVV